MEPWPAGTKLVLENDGSIALGYKYSNKKGVSMFLLNKEAYPTTDGDPYKSKFISDKGIFTTRTVGRPECCNKYFAAANVIDQHNQKRQGYLNLESHWKTMSGRLRCITSIIGMVVTDIHLITDQCFPTICPYVDLTTYEFTNALVYQMINFPSPNDSVYPYRPFIPVAGQESPRWYERVIHQSKRFTDLPSVISTDVSDLSSPVSIVSDNFSFSLPRSVDTQVTVRNATLPVGWSVLGKEQTVSCPSDAPLLPFDITSVHKQIKVKIAKGERSRACNMCGPHKKHGPGYITLKQKKPPFLCIECNQYFCHDTLSPKAGCEPRRCFWSHICQHYKNLGGATTKWLQEYESWEKDQILRCIDDDKK